MYRRMLEHHEIIAIIATAEGVMTYVSPAAERWFGYAVSDLENRSGFDYIHPEDLPRVHSDWDHVTSAEHGTVLENEFRARHRDGSWRTARQRIVNLLDDPAVHGMLITIRDVTELAEQQQLVTRLQEEAVQLTRAREELLARFRVALRGARVGVYEIDPQQGNVRWLEHAGTDLASDLQADGMPTVEDYFEQIHPGDRDRVRAEFEQVLGDGQPLVTEYRATGSDGRPMWIAATAERVSNPDGTPTVVGTFRDITAIKEATARLADHQERAHRVQRMQAIGRLASGVVHDFNNILTIIRGNCDLLADSGVDAPEVDEILLAANRGTELIDQLLGVAQHQPNDGSQTDTRDSMETVVRLATRLLDEGIHVHLEAAESLPPARLSPSQLEQILVNLVLNARDAMPHGGTLRLAAHAESQEHGHDGVRYPPSIHIEVTDTGTGIPHDIVPMIFEPFFTTKPPGQGAGLGLPHVDAVITDAGGHIALESTPGKGTAVQLCIPAGKPEERRTSATDGDPYGKLTEP